MYILWTTSREVVLFHIPFCIICLNSFKALQIDRCLWTVPTKNCVHQWRPWSPRSTTRRLATTAPSVSRWARNPCTTPQTPLLLPFSSDNQSSSYKTHPCNQQSQKTAKLFQPFFLLSVLIHRLIHDPCLDHVSRCAHGSGHKPGTNAAQYVQEVVVL